MSRENVEEKGRRLLTEGRITVLQVTAERIHAQARGDSADVYDLGYDARAQEWRCNCPAKSKCSHLVALQLVTIRPRQTVAA